MKQPGGSLAAAVGDGITDDKSAIQAIVNQAAISSIKKVFFPPGVYQVNGDIAIADSVELYGTQSGIAVIKARDAYAIKIHNASPVTHVSLKYCLKERGGLFKFAKRITCSNNLPPVYKQLSRSRTSWTFAYRIIISAV